MKCIWIDSFYDFLGSARQVLDEWNAGHVWDASVGGLCSPRLSLVSLVLLIGSAEREKPRSFGAWEATLTSP